MMRITYRLFVFKQKSTFFGSTEPVTLFFKCGLEAVDNKCSNSNVGHRAVNDLSIYV